MNKSLLFVGAGFETLPALGRAKALGYQVFVTDGSPEAPGIRWVKKHGAGWAVVSTYEWGDTLHAIVNAGWLLDGVIAVACDVGPTVSYVAEALGLPCIPFEVAWLGWDKPMLKDTLRQAGIPVPGNPITGKPYVIKPAIGGRGGRGVMLFDSWVGEDRPECEVARQYSMDGTSMTECWVSGPQVSTESIVWKGEVLYAGTGMTDRNYRRLKEFAPAIIEDGGDGPSRFEYTETGDAIIETLNRCVQALKIRDGTIKGDIVLDEERDYQPTIIELAIGRISGGYLATHQIPLNHGGMDFLGAAFAVACGDDPSSYLWHRTPRYTSVRYRFPRRPASHPERGRCFVAVAGGREEAIRKAEAWQRKSR